ncbi:hypothetical protein E3Q14_03358 [Wallemia mellicola]|nr:hypothetical protein E3Q14_03358 [Wallemia mellicola]
MRFKLLSTFITALLPLVRSDFSFEVKNYVACGMLEVEYSGANGSPDILILPTGGDTQNITMLGYPTNGNKGEDTYILPEFKMPTGQEFTVRCFTFQIRDANMPKVTMGDKDGFGTGGTSEKLKAQDYNHGNGCIPTDGGMTKYAIISNSSQWNSCDTINIRVYDMHNLKDSDLIDYYAITPNTRPIHIQSTHGKDNGTINYQLTQGEQNQVQVFSLYRGDNIQYDLGGRTDLHTLGPGSDDCKKPLEPSPTASSQTIRQSDDSGAISKGAIAGIVIGAVIGSAALVAASMFFFVKYKRHAHLRLEYAQKLESDLGHRSPGEDLDDMGPVTPFTLNNPQQSASNQDNSTRSPASMTNDSTHTPLNSSNQQSLQSGPSDKGPKYHRDGGPVVQNDGIGTETDDTDVPPTYEDASRIDSPFRNQLDTS